MCIITWGLHKSTFLNFRKHVLSIADTSGNLSIIVERHHVINQGNKVNPTIEEEDGTLLFIYDMSSSRNGFSLQLVGVNFPFKDSSFKFGYSGNLEYSKGKYTEHLSN